MLRVPEASIGDIDNLVYIIRKFKIGACTPEPMYVRKRNILVRQRWSLPTQTSYLPIIGLISRFTLIARTSCQEAVRPDLAGMSVGQRILLELYKGMPLIPALPCSPFLWDLLCQSNCFSARRRETASCNRHKSEDDKRNKIKNISQLVFVIDYADFTVKKALNRSLLKVDFTVNLDICSNVSLTLDPCVNRRSKTFRVRDRPN